MIHHRFEAPDAFVKSALLSPQLLSTLSVDYHNAIVPAHDALQNDLRIAGLSYEASIVEAKRVFDNAILPAQEHFAKRELTATTRRDRRIYAADRVYKKALAPAQKAYDEGVAAATKLFGEQMANTAPTRSQVTTATNITLNVITTKGKTSKRDSYEKQFKDELMRLRSVMRATLQDASARFLEEEGNARSQYEADIASATVHFDNEVAVFRSVYANACRPAEAAYALLKEQATQRFNDAVADAKAVFASAVDPARSAFNGLMEEALATFSATLAEAMKVFSAQAGAQAQAAFEAAVADRAKQFEAAA
jgi:hypothetical protein